MWGLISDLPLPWDIHTETYMFILIWRKGRGEKRERREQGRTLICHLQLKAVKGWRTFIILYLITTTLDKARLWLALRWDVEWWGGRTLESVPLGDALYDVSQLPRQFVLIHSRVSSSRSSSYPGQHCRVKHRESNLLVDVAAMFVLPAIWVIPTKLRVSSRSTAALAWAFTLLFMRLPYQVLYCCSKLQISILSLNKVTLSRSWRWRHLLLQVAI